MKRASIFNRSFLVWAALFLWAIQAHGAAPASIFQPRGASRQAVAVQYEYLDDQKGTFTFEEVKSGAAGQFKPLEKTNLGFGYKKVLWVRFTIDFANYHEPNFFLLQNHGFIWHWSIFFPGADGYQVKELSETDPIAMREFRTHNYIVEFPTPDKPQGVYYMRFDPGGHALAVDLSFSGKRGLIEFMHDSMLAMGLFFGALLAMLAYNSVLYLYLRSKDYLYYIYYLSCSILIFAYLDGFAPLVFDSVHFYVPFFRIAGFATIHGMTLFARQFLSLKSTVQWLDRYLVCCQWLLCCGMVVALFVPVSIPFPMLTYMLMLTTPALIVAGLIRWWQGFEPARLYSAGWAVYAGTILLYSVLLIGVVPSNFFTNYALQIASVWEAMLFALALAYRIKLAERKASQAKNAFLGMISHELKTPLQGIATCVDFLMLRLKNTREIEYVDRLRQAAEQLEAQVKDLTDFARLESGKMQLHCKTFSFAHLVRDTVESFRAEAENKELEIRLSLQDEVMMVHSDPLRIQQILNNLISNAIKYTERGHVEVRCRFVPRAPGVLEMAVEDTGIGINRKDFPALFEPFTQIDQSSTRKHEGIGMGLAIVRKLIGVFGGTIDIESTPGEGSIFTAAIPVRIVDAPQPHDGDESAVDGEESGTRILLVDDNQSVRRDLSELAEQLGYRCEMADCGRDALDKMKSREYKAILLDLNMPDIDGFSVAAEIRGRPGRNQNTPIVWISATAPENVTLEQKSLFTHFLEKPIRIGNLSSMLRALVG